MGITKCFIFELNFPLYMCLYETINSSQTHAELNLEQPIPQESPYSGKLSREKTFTNFAVLWLYAKVFSVKFGAWRPLAWQKRAIRESFLHKDRIFTNLRKFSPSKVYWYTVMAQPHNIPYLPHLNKSLWDSSDQLNLDCLTRSWNELFFLHTCTTRAMCM